MKSITQICFMLSTLSLFFTNNCSAGLVSNPSFEEPWIFGAVWAPFPTNIPGWTSTGGPLADHFDIHGTIWASQDGEQHIELDSPLSTIEQTVSGLQVGTEYLLTFGLTGNPDLPNTSYSIDASVFDHLTSLSSETYSVVSASERSSVIWTDHTLTFTASATQLRIVFSRGGTGEFGFGPDLDNVRLVAVPEPSSAFLLAFVSLGFNGLRRMRR